MKKWFKKPSYFVLFFAGLLVLSAESRAQNKKLTFEDVMKWEDISSPVISSDGTWLAYNVWPDRGNGYIQIQNVDTETQYSIASGKNPRMTDDGKWIGAFIKPRLVKQMKADDQKPKQGLALLNTDSGETIEIDSVKTYQFSNDGKWALARLYQNEVIKKQAKKNDYLGSEMILMNLVSGQKLHIQGVREAAFDSTSKYIAYSVADTSGEANGLYYRDLTGQPARQQTIEAKEQSIFGNLSWNNQTHQLAFTQAKQDTSCWLDDAYLKMWNPTGSKTQTLVEPSDVAEEWALRMNNKLVWTDDGQRLYFGLMPQNMADIIRRNAQDEQPDSIKIYDRNQILGDKTVALWHYKDPLIKPHAKKSWDNRKKQTYRAVYHLKSDQWVQLADRQMPKVKISQNPEVALGYTGRPYRRLQTWDGSFRDYFIVNLTTGERTRVAEKLRYRAHLSPKGEYVTFYEDKQWHLYDIENDLYRNLMEDIEVPFYNEEFDRPQSPPSYGLAGWMKDDQAVLIYDKYDLWEFATGQKEATNLTGDGRDRDIQYRIMKTDKDRSFFDPSDELLLRSFYDTKKTYGFYTLNLEEEGTSKQLETDHKYRFITKAEDANRIFYTRESYDQYPNLWMSSGYHFDDTRRVTDLHLDLHEQYNWGQAELVSWNSLDDGRELQGALIKPDNYEEDKEYPVLVYFYAHDFSQRAYEFNNITNDDRPTLPQYVSDGYVVFLPDIRYKIGAPGSSATKSLVPGVLKLIEMGIADEDKIGLQGHSWGGYETAFMVTQTDIFGAAVAGAPVGNMTSSYSGIRWGSGRARQFQYEKGQSRIGGSLWEYPERYIENSPVFYADRINTPLLIMTGDEDTAVPWYQDMEMHLAMRRLGKKSIMLQYHGEPHHLQEYPNKLDYAIRMKEYFDYYLRHKGEPKWIIEGVPYEGK